MASQSRRFSLSFSRTPSLSPAHNLLSRSRSFTLRLNLTISISISHSQTRSITETHCHRRHHSHGLTLADSWSHGCSLSLYSLLTDFQASSPFFKKAQSVNQVHNETTRNGMKCLILKCISFSFFLNFEMYSYCVGMFDLGFFTSTFRRGCCGGFTLSWWLHSISVCSL